MLGEGRVCGPHESAQDPVDGGRLRHIVAALSGLSGFLKKNKPQNWEGLVTGSMWHWKRGAHRKLPNSRSDYKILRQRMTTDLWSSHWRWELRCAQ